MKRKKGFTLLEVLLVIDVLIIIAMITISIVINNMEKSKKSAFKQDVHSIFKSAEINLRTTVPDSYTCYGLDVVDVTHKDKFISGEVCKDSNHNYQVNNLCTESYCFNGSQEEGIVTAFDFTNITGPNMLKYNAMSALGSDIEDIKDVDFFPHSYFAGDFPPEKVVDLSSLNDGSIMGYLVDVPEEAGPPFGLSLWVFSGGDIILNLNSNNLFKNFKSMTLFHDNFDASRVISAQSMFEGCSSLTQVDIYFGHAIKSIDYMFRDTTSLTRVFVISPLPDLNSVSQKGVFDGSNIDSYEYVGLSP